MADDTDLIDFVQAFGAFLSIHGIAVNSIMSGPFCTFQGVVLQCGLLAEPIWTFVVTINTFIMLVGGPGPRAWAADKSSSGKARWIVCFGIWTFILFIGVCGLLFIEPFHPENGTYCILDSSRQLMIDNYAGAGWCWINANYFWERIFFFYGTRSVFFCSDFSFRIYRYICHDCLDRKSVV